MKQNKEDRACGKGKECVFCSLQASFPFRDNFVPR